MCDIRCLTGFLVNTKRKKMKHYLTGIALFLGFSACTGNEKHTEIRYLSHIGDTEFLADTDGEGFQPCHPDLAIQYYNLGHTTGFAAEKPAIDRYFRQKYKVPALQGESGYFTVRFLVNCEGKSGWFRTEGMDFDYQPKEFNPGIANQLLKLSKELEGWKVAVHEEEKYDYYQYLTFKIENGQLIEILP